MTPEEQNMEAAILKGWKGITSSKEMGMMGESPDGRFIRVPDYYNDLNETHELEKSLDSPEQSDYNTILNIIFDRECEEFEHLNYYFFHIPAKIRLKAFLKTKHKWRD